MHKTLNTVPGARPGWFLILLMLGFAVLLATPAQAARIQPIVNVENASVPAGLDERQVRNAIIEGCGVRGWRADATEPGLLRATVQVRDHTAVVDIRYDTQSYSITYADSTNLKYKDGKIHRNYNSWVQNLNGDIRNSLLRATP